jgi:hypothetical protein
MAYWAPTEDTILGSYVGPSHVRNSFIFALAEREYPYANFDQAIYLQQCQRGLIVSYFLSFFLFPFPNLSRSISD